MPKSQHWGEQGQRWLMSLFLSIRCRPLYCRCFVLSRNWRQRWCWSNGERVSGYVWGYELRRTRTRGIIWMGRVPLLYTDTFEAGEDNTVQAAYWISKEGSHYYSWWWTENELEGRHYPNCLAKREERKVLSWRGPWFVRCPPYAFISCSFDTSAPRRYIAFESSWQKLEIHAWVTIWGQRQLSI